MFGVRPLGAQQPGQGGNLPTQVGRPGQNGRVRVNRDSVVRDSLRKLGDSTDDDPIETVRNVGYRLRVPRG